MTLYGLIGFPLSHSLSAEYFSAKFHTENITDKKYLLFPLERIEDLKGLIMKTPELRGLNVTIPYKEKIIPFVDELDGTAEKIGAVNTIKIFREYGRVFMTGYNTDADGFRQSMDFSGIRQALILGTGGASRAVRFVLNEMGIGYRFVSREPKDAMTMDYSGIDEKIMAETDLIINATPIGMYPDINSFLPIPYNLINGSHYLYDLVYNPETTVFLKKGLEQGARVQNGMKMLHLQAEKAYEIWEDGR